MAKKRIAIVFDGVIHLYLGWVSETEFNSGKIVPGMKEAIDQLKDQYEICIFSTRCTTETGKKALIDKLTEWGVYYDLVTCEKLAWDLLIDDRCLQFDGNVHHMLKQLQNFKPWWYQRPVIADREKDTDAKKGS